MDMQLKLHEWGFPPRLIDAVRKTQITTVEDLVNWIKTNGIEGLYYFGGCGTKTVGQTLGILILNGIDVLDELEEMVVGSFKQGVREDFLYPMSEMFIEVCNTVCTSAEKKIREIKGKEYPVSITEMEYRRFLKLKQKLFAEQLSDIQRIKDNQLVDLLKIVGVNGAHELLEMSLGEILVALNNEQTKTLIDLLEKFIVAREKNFSMIIKV